MSANSKTRLYIADGLNDSRPFQIQAVIEFDIYQEALDYAYNLVYAQVNYLDGSTEAMNVFVMSYTNTQYWISSNSSTPSGIRVVEVHFPNFP